MVIPSQVRHGFWRKGVETEYGRYPTTWGKGIVQTTNPDILSGAAKAVVVRITRRSLVQIQAPLPIREGVRISERLFY